MKKLASVVWLLLLSLSCQLGFAQEDSEREGPPSEQEQSAEQEQAAASNSDEQEQDRVGNESPESPADISRAFEDFVPSAQVSEDLSVSFPVDI